MRWEIKVFFSYRASTFLCQFLSQSFSLTLSLSASPHNVCLFKAVCFSSWILSECGHEDCCFWLSNKNRCAVPDRNYKLLSTNTEYVPFSSQGWLEYISLQQSDRKENKKMCHRVMAEITVLQFNEKWRRTVIWQFVQWAGFTDERHKWFYLFMHRDTLWRFTCTRRVNIWSLIVCLYSPQYTQMNKSLQGPLSILV